MGNVSTGIADPLTKRRQLLEVLYASTRPTAKDYYRNYLKRVRAERALARATIAYFSRLEETYSLPSILATVRRQLESVTKAKPDPQEDKADAKRRSLVDAVTRLMEMRMGKVSFDALMDELANVAMLAGDLTVQDLALGSGFTWVDPPKQFRELFKQLHAEVEDMIAAATRSHAKAIARIIVNAANPASPLTIQEAVKRVREERKTLTRNAAVRLVRTETARVYGRVSQETMERNKIPARRWMTARNSPIAATKPVCPTCSDNARQGWVDTDKEFASGHSAPPAHPYCRCDIAADTRDWLPPRVPFLGEDLEDLAASVTTTADVPTTIEQKRRFKLIPVGNVLKHPAPPPHVQSSHGGKRQSLPQTTTHDLDEAVKRYTEYGSSASAIRNAADNVLFGVTGGMPPDGDTMVGAVAIMREAAKNRSTELLYRGMSVPGSLDDLEQAYKGTDAIDISLASTTSDHMVGQNYASRGLPNEQRVLLVFKPNAAALDVSGQSSFQGEKESIVHGRYAVDSVTRTKVKGEDGLEVVLSFDSTLVDQDFE